MDWRSVGNVTSLNASVKIFHIVPLQLHVFNGQRRRLSSLLPPGGVPLVRGPRPGAREIDVDVAVDAHAIIITTSSISIANVVAPRRPATFIAIWLTKAPPLAIAMVFIPALIIATVIAQVPAVIPSASIVVGIVPITGAIVTAASIGHPPIITTATQITGIIISV